MHSSLRIRLYPVYVFIARKFYFDQAYNSFAAWVLAKGALPLFRTVERGVFELFGPRGVFELFLSLYYRAVRARSPFLVTVFGLSTLALVGVYVFCLGQLLGQ